MFTTDVELHIYSLACNIFISLQTSLTRIAFKRQQHLRLGCSKLPDMSARNKTLCLFDVDGTLTVPQKDIEPSLYTFLIEKVKPLSQIGIVGGSDLPKIIKQMGGRDFFSHFDYVFAENGLVAFKYKEEIGKQSIQAHMGEENLKKLINYALRYLSEIEIPVKRGTFIEFRTGMLNISPVGRACSRKEREEFLQYDNVHKIRAKFVDALRSKFPDLGLTFSIGGQISIDVFPTGWDKSYCLQFVESSNFEKIHFFGDKTDEGGNDYEIFSDPRVIGHKVVSPEDTKLQLETLLSI